MDSRALPHPLYIVTSCSKSQFEDVVKYIAQFELDDRELKPEEFVTLSDEKELVGFGRVREHKTCSELCSLGVVEKYRDKGVGKQLMQAMIQKATQVPYLVCIIPSYFEDFGFSICHDYPAEIEDKLRYCVGSLPVEERYVVMRRM